MLFNINDFEDDFFLTSPFRFHFESPTIFFRESEWPEPESAQEIEIEPLKELRSKNETFMQEKSINYRLYPLYINWKKIETKSKKNIYYNIFKLFGYFGEAIFDILIDINKNELKYYNHKKFLYQLNSYKKYYTEGKIIKNDFMDKLISIYDDVISLIKNKIIIFKEITIFIIILRLYENYYAFVKDNNKLLEVLKYEFFIIYHLKEAEYKKIYDKYFKTITYYNGDYEDDDDDEIFHINNSKSFPINRTIYINHIKDIYKRIKKKNQKIKEEN